MRTKIAEFSVTGIVCTRILRTIIAGMLSLNYRNNFKRLADVIDCNENTVHNWMKRSDLNLVKFNANLIKSVGSGHYAVAFDPSYISKSGKCTPGVGRYWSGQAGQVKYGLDAACLAVCDRKLHTAFHLNAAYTPSPSDLKASGKNLMSYYTEYVARHADRIIEFGGFVVADAYFGTKTFVNGLRGVGLHLVSSLKSNAVLHYEVQSLSGTRKRGRPAQKGIRIDWKNLDTSKIMVVKEDTETRVTSGIVWSKSLRKKVHLVRVEFLKEDGSVRATKLLFCTDLEKNWAWIWETYRLRFQIEFVFRDGKQHIGLTHCQSTNKVKMENHLNLSLTAVNVAKACHWKHEIDGEAEPFSMADIKSYYQNLNLLNRISCALNLNQEEILNNPKIINILLSSSYEKIAA
jgi:hypothetical protein